MTDHVDALTPAGVSELATFIIRPPRAQYSRADLGERSFFVDATPASREDLTLVNPRGHHLHCSHFRPHHTSKPPPTLVYLHGNGSCRVDATVLLPLTIPYGIALFAFDFSGSGRSDGEFISLGVWERHDVETVISHLVRQRVDHILLWGHSMGAATALMYAGLCAQVPSVKGLVLDSPFASFDKLAQSLVADMALPRGLPRKFVLSVGVRAVRKLVRERAGFDVNDIDPLSATKSINPGLPALFMHGTADAVVPFSHGQLLYEQYPAPAAESNSEADGKEGASGFDSSVKRWLPLANLEHDSPRPESAMDQAFVFMQRQLRDSTSLDFLEALKARGNVAMLSSRYVDAIYLYTQALDTLAETTTKMPAPTHPAVTLRGRRHHVRPVLNQNASTEGLVRRNSSFPSILSTVKRWRHSRTPLPPSASAPQTDDEDDAAVPFCPPRSNRLHLDRHRRASTDIAAQFRRSSLDPNIGAGAGGSTGGDPMASIGSVPTETLGSVDAKTLTSLVDDESRSENSAHSARFAQKHSWRARNMVDLIKKRVRGLQLQQERHEQLQQQQQHTIGEIDEDVLEDGEDHSLPTPTPPSSSPPPTAEGHSRSVHTDATGNVAVNGSGNFGEEDSRRSSRSSRSSSRVRLRHRSRRDRLKRFRDLREADRLVRDEVDKEATRSSGGGKTHGVNCVDGRSSEGGGIEEALTSEMMNGNGHDQNHNGLGGGAAIGARWFSGTNENINHNRMWQGLSSRDSSGLRSRFSSSGPKRGGSRLSGRGAGAGFGSGGVGGGSGGVGGDRKDMISGANGILRAVGLNGVGGAGGGGGGALERRRRSTESNGPKQLQERTKTGKGGSTDVREWVLDSAQRALALALLGNRSLARRKVQDVNGALADATRCLQLDNKWVRGYLRKAAALRESGQLQEAREAVVAGLGHEPHHAGLIDMLDSIENAVSEMKS